MRYQIAVEKTFSAAHAIRGYRGKCERLHGHTWKVRFSVSGGKLDRLGMVMDFTDLKAMLDSVLSKLDHRNLNEVEPFDRANPTAELIARHIYEQMKLRLKAARAVKIVGVTVWESESSSATVGG